jgi:hypothetical protein
MTVLSITLISAPTLVLSTAQAHGREVAMYSHAIHRAVHLVLVTQPGRAAVGPSSCACGSSVQVQFRYYLHTGLLTHSLTGSALEKQHLKYTQTTLSPLLRPPIHPSRHPSIQTSRHPSTHSSTHSLTHSLAGTRSLTHWNSLALAHALTRPLTGTHSLIHSLTALHCSDCLILPPAH